jgi:hypothetical protein
MRRQLLRLLAVCVLTGALGLAPGSAGSASAAGPCTQAPQSPWAYQGLLHWGTLVICDRVIVSATFTGYLEHEGLPWDVKAGPALETPSALMFWDNVTACIWAPTTWRSVILTANMVLLDGTVVTLGVDTGPIRTVTC